MSAKDYKAWLTLAEEYGVLYYRWFTSLLVSPSRTIALTRSKKISGDIGNFLIIVTSISIFIGASIGSIIPDRPEIQTRVIIFSVVSILWIFQGFLVGKFCKWLGGKESVEVTIYLMVQNLAFVYVLSNFLALITLTLGANIEFLENYLSGKLFYQQSGLVLFSYQFLMLLYLVPVTVSKAHGFRGFAWGVIAFFSATFAITFGAPVYATGGC